MKKFFLIFIIIFSLIGFVGCTQKDDTKSQFIKDFDIDIEEKDILLTELVCLRLSNWGHKSGLRKEPIFSILLKKQKKK